MPRSTLAPPIEAIEPDFEPVEAGKPPDKRGTVATDQGIKSLPVDPAKVYLRMFVGGIGVRVFPTGAKTFVYWYRKAGTDSKRMLTLGSYPAMSLKQAREALLVAQVQRNEGTDPAAAKAADRVRKRAANRGELIDSATLTVRSAFDAWRAGDLAPVVESDGTRHGRKDGGAGLAATFAKHVFPVIGALPLATLGKGDVLAVIDRAKNAGVRRTAGVLLSSLRQMLDWCEDREYIAKNPTRDLKKKRIVGKSVVRTRVLDDAELALFVRNIGHVNLHVVTVLALRFVLATGQRPGEVAGMPKTEVVRAGELWSIPAERYKTGEPHSVPLSAHARALLAEAGRYNAGSDYVFPSPTTDARPLDRHSLSRAVLRKHVSMGVAKAFTPHDLRRTCRTQMAARGVPDFIGEKVLGHKLEGMLAVYNLHDYLIERRDALDRWGDALDTLDNAGRLQT